MTPSTRRVLLVEDNDSDAQLYAAMLQELQADMVDNPTATPTEVERVKSLEPGLAELTDREQTYDAVLLDLNLPDSTGLETVDRVVDADSDVAIVVLTSVGDQRLGTEAVDKGAQDFLIKDHVTPRVLAKTVTYAQTRKAQTKQIERQRNELSVLNWLIRHEIRNDASIILGWASALEADSPSEQRSLDRIEDASNHIVTLTESVGELISTLEDERTELDAVQLGAVLDAEVTHFRENYESASVSLTGDASDASVKANQFLGTVLRNVLLNAVDHNDTDTPSIEIDVHHSAAGDTDAETTTIEGDAEQEYVWVDIADNGPGIPAETKASVMEKAYSGDADGTGVGLYLVNKFMQQYEGEIRIEDSSPRGTVVRLGFVPAA
ncbi:MAG: hybrid sensor histidine kinase/response regulator [Halodesulfurarchaeum sp.]|nr:hybrid sensor histidine kinase/response regulator [Halodesulfurarchaeum sp.]